MSVRGCRNSQLSKLLNYTVGELLMEAAVLVKVSVSIQHLCAINISMN